MSMRIEKTPHAVHLLFCTNTRENGDESCGDTPDIKILADTLKHRFKKAGLPVRVSKTGCLGPCAKGPNIMCYPQGVWFQKVKEKDADAIEAKVLSLLGGPGRGDIRANPAL